MRSLTHGLDGDVVSAASIGRLLVYAGFGMVLVGSALLADSGLSAGGLPGDFVYSRGRATFYLPIATSMLISVLLTVLFKVIVRWRR